MRFEEINAILLRDLEAAMAEFDSCIKEFGRVVKEFYLVAPSPDGGLAVRLASDRRCRAFHKLEEALARHHAFIMHGVAPPDLIKTDVPFGNAITSS